MKKQGSLYLKIITIVLAVFLAGYALLSMFVGKGVVHSIETVVYCEVGDGETVSGFVVRDEKVLTSSAPIVVCELTEGERVGKGQAVATGYTNDSARQSREQLFSLQNQREQLRMAARETDGKNSKVLDTQIADMIISVAVQANEQRMDALRTYVAELEPLVLRRCVSGDDADEIESRIDRIDERISLLTRQSAGGAEVVLADEAGYFSQSADGYEYVLTPQSIMNADPGDIKGAKKSNVAENAVGKLAVGQKWYFATEIPEERPCAVGDYLTVSFAAQGLQELDMKVERLTPSQEGKNFIVLSSSRHMHRVTDLRTQTAEIIFDTYEGLRIPKQALYVVDGLTGVYVLEAGRAEWKTVDKLLQYGNYYLISWDRSNTDGLWPDDQIILTDEKIADGTVILE